MHVNSKRSFNLLKWIRCSYGFPGLAPSQLLLGIRSTGLQLKLFPAARRSALLRPADYSTRARKTYFQQKVWVMLFTFLTVHVSRVTLEGRHNALKNGSSSTFLRAWSKRLNLKRRNRRRRGRRRGRRKRRRRRQRIKAVPVLVQR